MYKSPRKEREDKYERLLYMIRNYEHSKEELRLLNKIKSDTVFQISLRQRRCEANKKYKFPFNKDRGSNEDDDIEELNPTKDGKDIVYDLNSQNRENIGARIRIPTIGKVSPRQKVQTQPSQKEKARSLSRKIKRVLIGRLEDEAIMTKERFLETYRAPTESTLSSQKNSVKKLSAPKNRAGSRTCRASTEKIKTQQSPEKKKPTMFHQFQTLTLKRIANRLRTQKSNEKKSRMETLVSDQLKRQAKHETLIKCASSALKIKPKNILQKNLY